MRGLLLAPSCRTRCADLSPLPESPAASSQSRYYGPARADRRGTSPRGRPLEVGPAKSVCPRSALAIRALLSTVRTLARAEVALGLAGSVAGLRSVSLSWASRSEVCCRSKPFAPGRGFEPGFADSVGRASEMCVPLSPAETRQPSGRPESSSGGCIVGTELGDDLLHGGFFDVCAAPALGELGETPSCREDRD